MNRLSVIALASMSLTFGLVAGCSGSPETPDLLANEKVYLDDQAMDSFDADLHALSDAVRRDDTKSEAGLRVKISENARLYQRALVSALYDGDSTARRAMAAILLGFTGDSAVIPALMNVVGSSEPEGVRLNAVLGLLTMEEKLRDYKDHSALMMALAVPMGAEDSSVEMRRACVQAYAAAYDRTRNDRLDVVRLRFTSDPSIDVQIAAIFALGQVNDLDSVPRLIAIGLRHPEPEIREATAIALGNIQDPARCIPALADACEDEDPMTRREAMDAISRHHGGNRELVYGTLIAGLSDFDWQVRESAALSLARLRDTRAIEPLIQATGDRTSLVRQAAVISLGELISPEREKEAYPLIELLGDNNPDVATATMLSLKKIVNEDFGNDQPRWRVYYHTKYPDLNPALMYEGKPRPRTQSGINSSGSRRTTGTANQQNRNWQQPNRNNQQNRNNQRPTTNRNNMQRR